MYKLKPYALTDDNSRGRKVKEEHHSDDFRCEFQHDRDRIIHSKAFRRLEAKTQVVLVHESDHNRTRLTHSMEVAQISESIAMKLALNRFATLAIALGHDLGHSPFGHTGERALNDIQLDFGLGRFKHNYQGLLVVNNLEERYKKEHGLNLMFETREGILKHSSLKSNIDLSLFDSQISTNPGWATSLEGQIVSLVDEVAQRTHDTDDALRSNRIHLRELVEVDFVKDAIVYAGHSVGDLLEEYYVKNSTVRSAVIQSMIKYYVSNTISSAQQNISDEKISTYQDLVDKKPLIIKWAEDFEEKDKKFSDNFLKPKFYEHHEIHRMDSRAEYFIKKIFKAFKSHPKQLPEQANEHFTYRVQEYINKEIDTAAEGSYKNDLQAFMGNINKICKQSCIYVAASKNPTKEQIDSSKCPLQKHGERGCEGLRVIVNHIAGMTDKYAHLEYSRLYFPTEISRL